MKKVLSVLALLMCMALVSFSQEKIANAANEVVKAKEAVVSTGAIVATGVNNGAAALHKSVVDGVSTLHQDLAAAVPTVYTDSKGIIKTLYDDGNRAINYLVPKIESVITSLAAGLKTTSAEVWRILVYKQVAMGVTNLIYAILGLIAIGAYFVSLSKILEKVKEKNGYWSEAQGAFTIIGGILSLGIAVGIVMIIPNIVAGLMIPEAGALNEAVSLTQQLLQSFK